MEKKNKSEIKTANHSPLHDEQKEGGGGFCFALGFLHILFESIVDEKLFACSFNVLSLL